MTPRHGHDDAYLAEDAADRRVALSAATELAAGQLQHPFSEHERHEHQTHWLNLAEHAYCWLRNRRTLRAVRLDLVPGTPYPEGSIPVTATIDLSDTNELPFTLAGADAKGAVVDAPADTYDWTLTDPDASGAVLTVADDTMSATVAAGTPTANLAVSVAGETSGLQGAESIIVQATAATTISLVPGTPTAE